MPSSKPSYHDMPGYLIRRVNQLLVAHFFEKTSDHNITPVQWVALCATQKTPGMDQITLSRDIAIDTSTVAGVIDRLEARGLIKRAPSDTDKRVKLLFITKKGETLLSKTSPMVIDLQDWLLSPLKPKERKTFLSQLQTLIDSHEPQEAHDTHAALVKKVLPPKRPKVKQRTP
jgi:DNA-binding MarR family transcriptional regulator